MRLSPAALVVASVMASSVTPSLAAAQSIPSPYTFLERKQEAGIYSGYRASDSGRFGFGPDGGLLIGGRYAVQLAGPLALEGILGFMSGERDIINPARVVGDQVVGQGDVLLTTVDARLRFSFVGDRSWHGISPFVAFGGGAVFDAAAEPEIEASLDPADVFDFGTSFFGTFGAGTRIFLTERFALRLDGVFTLWQIDTPPGFSDPTRGFENVEESEWLSAKSFSIALLYRW